MECWEGCGGKMTSVKCCRGEVRVRSVMKCWESEEYDRSAVRGVVGVARVTER